MWSRWWPVAMVVVLASPIPVSLLTACSGSGPKLARELVTYSKGLPPAITSRPAQPTAPIVGWASAGRIYIVTMGSSTCPNLPVTVRPDGPHRLIIKTKLHAPARACTADLGPTTSTVALPASIDPSTPLRVEIDGHIMTLNPR